MSASEASAIPARRAGRFFAPYYLAAVAATVVAVLVVILGLHHDPYRRYLKLEATDYVKAHWIYERLHFDPTPVDVAFIGTSHTLHGVDSAVVERALNAQGGPALHVVNLALPHPGEDTHFALVRQLLATKRPLLVVIEQQYLLSRAGHPAFAVLADTADQLPPPGPHPDMFANALALLHRQVELWASTLLEGGGKFDAARFAGDHWDDTYQINWRNGRTPPRLEVAKDLAPRAARERASQESKGAQFGRWGWLMLAYNQAYLERTVDALRQAGVQVVFLYLPPYRFPDEPLAAGELRRMAEIIKPQHGGLLDDPALWADVEHLNWPGAQVLSAWLGERLRGTVAPVAASAAR
jgi:hypothetical protein